MFCNGMHIGPKLKPFNSSIRYSMLWKRGFLWRLSSPYGSWWHCFPMWAIISDIELKLSSIIVERWKRRRAQNSRMHNWTAQYVSCVYAHILLTLYAILSLYNTIFIVYVGRVCFKHCCHLFVCVSSRLKYSINRWKTTSFNKHCLLFFRFARLAW